MTAKGINKASKFKNRSVSKRHPRSKKENREEKKITFSGKKKASVHILDEDLYNRVKVIFGLSRSNFYRVTDKRIMFKILARFIEWCVKCLLW